MNKFFTLLFVFSLLTAQKKDHTLKVIYDLTYQIDSLDNQNIRSERMFLFTNKKLSSYESEVHYLKDSILKSNNPQGLFGISKSKFRYKIFKNKTEQKINTLYDYTRYKFYIEENFPNLDWKIGTETKKILGFECTKANVNFAGRDYIAWFTNEIAISDGPYKFSGLPGLIMEIYDTKKHYKHIVIGIEKVNNNLIFDNKGFTKISKVQFNDFLKKIKEKPSLILYNPGIQIPKAGLDKYDRRHRERLKHENNPIELQ